MSNAGFSRRGFLTSAASVAGGSYLSSLIAPTGVVSAAEPIVRTGKSHFKLSLAAYSFHRYLPFNYKKPFEGEAKMNLDDFVNFCAEQNLDGTELTSYYFPTDTTTDYLLHLKEMTFRLGLDISGTAIGNDFCVVGSEAREQQLAYTRQWIDNAAIMGAPCIRIFAGTIPQGDTEEAARERCISAIDEAVEYAATKGVILALENHGGITATPEQILKIITAVKPSPWFGVNFDGGNFHTADPYASLEQIAPYTVNAQLKVEVTPEGQPKQPSDLKRMVGVLKDAGYRGYLVLEYEAEEEPHEAIPRHLQELRDIIAS
ncbi:MAG: sugar phosphate isomerase/epimerase [Planctomycetota bacterium]|nr:sugar phosphate isomerase/epimerase [Planctomycetota bacterium]